VIIYNKKRERGLELGLYELGVAPDKERVGVLYPNWAVLVAGWLHREEKEQKPVTSSKGPERI